LGGVLMLRNRGSARIWGRRACDGLALVAGGLRAERGAARRRRRTRCDWIAVAPVAAASRLDGRRRTGAGAPCQNGVHRAPSPRSDAQGRWEAARGGGIRMRLRATSRAHPRRSAHALPSALASKTPPDLLRRATPRHRRRRAGKRRRAGYRASDLRANALAAHDPCAHGRSAAMRCNLVANLAAGRRPR
jgi:hypothetical protein